MYCRDNCCHDQLPIRQLGAAGGIHLYTVLYCNLGLKHKENNRRIKLRKDNCRTSSIGRV
eukprot:1630446-Prorocentrum_lima.AAC.1